MRPHRLVPDSIRPCDYIGQHLGCQFHFHSTHGFTDFEHHIQHKFSKNTFKKYTKNSLIGLKAFKANNNIIINEKQEIRYLYINQNLWLFSFLFQINSRNKISGKWEQHTSLSREKRLRRKLSIPCSSQLSLRLMFRKYWQSWAFFGSIFWKS